MDSNHHISAHLYHNLQVPKNAPFMLQPSPGRGWGAFATRPIQPGAVILTEAPLFVIRKPYWLINEADIQAAFSKTDKKAQHQFLCLRDNASSPFLCMTDAFAENTFALPNRDNASGPNPQGCFVLHSRINHSCVPNAKIPDDPPSDKITCYATKDIAAGASST